jgi:tetratricopeptide (TPR) repeat protein
MVFAVVALCAPLASPAPAIGDDDDDAPVAAKLDPNLQWQLADAAWSRREYDDAASLMLAYADTNPIGDNAVEALWRAYNVYKSYRPNPDRKKAVFTKGLALASRWTKLYADSDKNRAARAQWYAANFYDQEGDRVLAIAQLADLVKQFPGTPSEGSAYWTMAEWMREGHQCAGAIDNYKAYQKIAGICENWNVAAFRIGNCYEELHDSEKAVASYTSVIDQPKNNWGWWQLGAGAVDSARRSRALGDDASCRKLALKVTQSCPTEGGWADLQRQALQLLGQSPAKKIQIVIGRTSVFDTDSPSISGGTQINVRHDTYVQVRPRYLTPLDTLTASLSITSVETPEIVPEAFEKQDDPAGAKYVYTIVSPDKKGNVAPDAAFGFGRLTTTAAPPDGLTVTRKWVKKGADWGEATVRIQSSQRWKLSIVLPNNKTNPSNISNQPDEVSGDGKTFRWNDKADLSAGVTIKFPVEIGGSTADFYPAIRLERDTRRFPDRNETSSSAIAKLPEFTATLTAEKPFAYQLTFPMKYIVTLAEVAK